MAVAFLSGVLLLVLLPGSTSLLWSSGPLDNAVVYACAHGTLSLPWTLTLSPGDVIENVQWFFSGRSEELVATVVHGNFLTMPTFSGRVRQTTNAGIDIEHVQAMDKGNYSVEVIGRRSNGDLVTLWRSAVLYVVTDSLQSSDGQLHVWQEPVAEYSNLSGQYHVVLRCGNFTYPSHPPFDVSWLTPFGLMAWDSPDSYQNGSFHLLLPNPIKGGSYACRVPPTSACLQGNSGEATLVVDKMEARLTLVEAQQSDLNQKNDALRTQVDLLKNNNSVLEAQVKVLENTNAALETKVSVLETGVSVLETKNEALEDLSRKQVSFHARMDTYTHLSTPSPVIMSRVIYNQGQAYDSTTGNFTAPFNGSYCFLVSSGNERNGKFANMFLMVENRPVAYVFADDDHANGAASGQAVVHLSTGQTVWLKSDGDSYYYYLTTSFSGFLVSPDL